MSLEERAAEIIESYKKTLFSAERERANKEMMDSGVARVEVSMESVNRYYDFISRIPELLQLISDQAAALKESLATIQRMNDIHKQLADRLKEAEVIIKLLKSDQNIKYDLIMEHGRNLIIAREKVAELEIYINDMRRAEYDIYRSLAPKLGLKPYGKSQIIWANSKEEADSLPLGDDIFKFVKQALSQKEST